MTSRPTDGWWKEELKKIEAREHCRCDNTPVHGHCLYCNSRIAEGEIRCSVCVEREKQKRYCSKCHSTFYLEAVKSEVSTPHRFDLCSEECYKPYLAEMLRSAGVPPKFMDCTLDGFSAYTRGLAEKLQLLQRWVDGDLSTGLYLFGSVGTGKTHLAVGVLRALIERGLRGRFVSARSFIMRCQTAFRQRESAEDIVNDLLGPVHFLILDDVGSEKVTEYARHSLLHLVDECYSRGVVLVITSNVDLQALNQIDERIASRVVEMCDRLRFDEPDFRVAIAKNRAKNDAPTVPTGRTLVQ